MEDHKPIRILMTADTVGGVWTYCMELFMMLPDVKFHVVTAGAKLSNAQKREIAELKNVVVYETTYKLEWMHDPWNDIDASGKWLLKLEEEIQPGIIHLNSYSYGVLPFNAPKVIVAHSDVFSWWMAVRSQTLPSQWNEYYKRIKAGLENADIVVAPSKAMMKNIVDIYGINAEHRVIYNGRNKNIFYCRKKQPFIFSMGRIWDEAKNIQCLVNAASQINYQIKIAGDNEYENDKFTLDTSPVEYLGKLDTKKIAQVLSKASVFVLPARYEPFGLSALEAALSRCALVLGDIPSLQEIWQDAAVYVDTDDEQALAKAINDLMNNKEQLELYQFKAAERAELFSSQIMADEYMNVYTHLMQHTKAFKKQEVV